MKDPALAARGRAGRISALLERCDPGVATLVVDAETPVVRMLDGNVPAGTSLEEFGRDHERTGLSSVVELLTRATTSDRQEEVGAESSVNECADVVEELVYRVTSGANDDLLAGRDGDLRVSSMWGSGRVRTHERLTTHHEPWLLRVHCNSKIGRLGRT